MATRTVKARVALDGEAEYKQALQEINTGNRTLASEMKKLQAEYKGNSESMEFLTKKGEILERQLLQQKDKVETLRQAVQKSAEQYGESDQRTQKWIQQLNNAEAAEFDLQHAIEENNAALQGEDNTMISLGDTVQQLANKMGITLPDGAKKALDGMGSFSAGTAAKMAIAAAAVAAVIKVVKELGEVTLQVAADMDNYLTESQITSLPLETLQAMDYAAPLIDVDAETIKSAMVKITKAMGDSSEQFDELGVSITNADGSMRSAEDVFYDVVDALGEMAPGVERDAAAMELMGKSAQDLNPLINQGSDALKAYGEEAKQVGYILSSDQVKALGAVDDAYQTLQLTIDGVKRQVAADFAPAAEKAMELFANAVQKAGDWLERSGLIENLASILGSVMSILEAIGKTVSNLPGLGSALDAINISLKAVAYTAAAVADAFNIIAGLMPQNWGSGMARTALGWNINNGQMSNLQQLMYNDTSEQLFTYDENYGAWIQKGYNATGNDNWRGGLTWVGEAGPELVALPGGSQILNAQDSRGFGGDTFYITIDAASVREFNDIVAIAQSARVRRRMR
jgi:hypothetical protein